MAVCDVTSARLRELLHYNPETGIFTWRVSRKGVKHKGAKAGSRTHNGYWRVCVDKTQMMAHVAAWAYMTGAHPTDDLDHINGDRLDNRFANLRQVTRSVNNQNQKRPQKHNKAGFLGVSPNRKRWSASIVVRGTKTHLGTFDTPALAHAAYLAAKRVMHPGNTL